jgi:hypothetical protein
LKIEGSAGSRRNFLQSSTLLKIHSLWISSGLEVIVPLILAYELPISDRGWVMRALQNADADGQHGTKPTAAPDTRLTTAGCEECGELLHGLNNALASVLLNAQVMAGKLPSYSRGKRYLHEIERNAQRGGELVKRLLERSQAKCHIDQCPGRPRAEAASIVGFDSFEPAGECDLPTQPVEQRPRP